MTGKKTFASLQGFRFKPRPLSLSIMAWTGLAVFSVPTLAQTSVPTLDKVVDTSIRTSTPASTKTTLIRAEDITGQPNQIIYLNNLVEVLQNDLKFYADKAIYYPQEDKVEAQGNVQLKKGGDCYLGNSLSYNSKTGAGYVNQAEYYLAQNEARGKADRIDFINDNQATITNGTITTCQTLPADWYLKADTLNIDTATDRGVARGSVLYFKGVPILGTPSWLPLSFPLSGQRHSGVLPPVIGHSNKGGLELGIPYYFNLMPNLDATLIPKVITKRGLQLGLEGRYLTSSMSGETWVEGIQDRLYQEKRYFFTSAHRQALASDFTFSWNVSGASDDDYPSDFSNTTARTAQRLLLRDVGFDYYGSFWHASLRSSSFQVLQDYLAPIAIPYAKKPQLNVTAAKYDWMGLDVSLLTSYTRFEHPELVNADRWIFKPEVAMPFLRSWYFVTPKWSYHLANYDIQDSRYTSNQARNIEIKAPTFSLDTGMYFEKNTALFGKAMTQTLEPRLFYVKIPYRDQSLVPLFDTAKADFNFAQIFQENRFVGYDRLGDANQLTMGLISRFIEMDGVERLKLAIAQRFQFKPTRVSLDSTTQANRSDILFAGYGQITPSFSMEAVAQVNQSQGHVSRSNLGVHWQPEAKKIIDVQLQYQKDILKQLQVAGQWPVAHRWYVVGKTNYSLSNNRMVEALAGVEYRDDCWAIRVVTHRFATTNINHNSGISIQLELTGLARLGQNSLEILKRNISGFQTQ